MAAVRTHTAFSLKVLYLQAGPADADRSILQQIVGVAPDLELTTVATPADALVEVRRMFGWQALVVSPAVAADEMVAMLDHLRRDRVPIAVAPVIEESRQELMVSALARGADAVLTIRDQTLVGVEETLARLARSPHLLPAFMGRRARVLYFGRDARVWTALEQLPYIEPMRADPPNAESISKLSSVSGKETLYDVAVIDDDRNAPLSSEVITRLKDQFPDLPTIVLSTPSADAAPPAPSMPPADVTIDKSGPFQHQLAGTLRRLHENIEVTLREAETKAREERLREIVDRVPAGIVVIGSDASVLAMNAEGLHLFGASTARQVVGRDFRSFLSAEDIPPMTALLHRLSGGDPETLSVHAETLDGRAVTLLR